MNIKKAAVGIIVIFFMLSLCAFSETKKLREIGRFKFAQIPFSIGTIAYSIPIITLGVVPAVIGWFGIVSSIVYGFGNGIELLKPGLKVPRYVGSGMILVFEIAVGIWLIFFPH